MMIIGINGIFNVALCCFMGYLMLYTVVNSTSIISYTTEPATLLKSEKSENSRYWINFIFYLKSAYNLTQFLSIWHHIIRSEKLTLYNSYTLYIFTTFFQCFLYVLIVYAMVVILHIFRIAWLFWAYHVFLTNLSPIFHSTSFILPFHHLKILQNPPQASSTQNRLFPLKSSCKISHF